MKYNLSVAVMLSVILAGPAFAGLNEAVNAFNKSDYQNAYPELLTLSNEGNAVAAYYLGRMYAEGLGVDQDKTQAVRYFERADKGYNSDATVRLGLMAIKGDGIAQDADLGMQYLKKAAYAGNENALYELGNLYESGDGVEKNYTYAFGFYYMGAVKGDRRAQLKTAQYYLAGRGIPQDYSAAVRWYVRAANQGYIPAQQEWANIRATHARLRNPMDAYSWYSILAAYNSDEVGQAAAARRDAIGSGFKSDVISAQQRKIMSWRPVSAENSVPQQEREGIMPVIPGFNDDATTQRRLKAGTSLYQDGTVYGITGAMIETALADKDRTPLEQAVEQAAVAGRADAYAYYGDLLKNRFANDAEAFKWYEKGAEADDAYAQYQLGTAYCEGRGHASDIGLCYGWLLTAVKHAENNLIFSVQNAVKTVEGSATPAELEKGRAFADERVNKTADKEKDKKAPGLFNLF